MELKKFCRKCGRQLIYKGKGEFTDAGITFDRETGEKEVADIYSCPSWWGGHDEYRVMGQNAYYYF